MTTIRRLTDSCLVVTTDAGPTLLERHGMEVTSADPVGVSSEDVRHEMTPTGAQPPNRAYTIDGVLTHPGDSYQPTTSAPVLALPLLVPWGSTTRSVEF